MIVRNNKEIINIYRGTRSIGNVYRGGVLVYTSEQPEPITYDGLTFEALEPSTIQYVPSTVATAQYSYDTVNWETADNITLNLNSGDRVFFKGNITGSHTTSDFARFRIGGNVAASGSIMSLQAGNPDDKTILYEYEFYYMFGGSALGLKDVSRLLLSATKLSNYCYRSLFWENTSIKTAPALPSTTLAQGCYNSLFKGCTSLTTAPELPATTLVTNCYSSLFQGCSSLTTAPELPAVTLKGTCYQYLFSQCSKLNYIKAMFTTTPTSTITGNVRGWVAGVAATGTFVKNKNATWDVSGQHGIPSGWTVELA